MKATEKWLTGNTTASEVGSIKRTHTQTIRLWASDSAPRECIPVCFTPVCILDATSISEYEYVIIARTKDNVLGWVFSKEENQESYERLIQHIYGVSYFVTDGHKACISAIRRLHPEAQIQRCMVHVQRRCRSFLTQNPRHTHGRVLLDIVNQLTNIRTKRQKRRWKRTYFAWRKRSDTFLKQKTYYTSDNQVKWWYTHRNLRKVRTHIDNAIDDLFRYVSGAGMVPRNTNDIEGGVNSRLKELIHRHRGLSVIKVRLLTTLFLRQKCMKKPTRKYH